MKRMFYAAHTPSFLSPSLTLSPLSSYLRPPRHPRSAIPVSLSLGPAVSLVGQNTYRTYRLLPAAFPVILSGHRRRPARELLLTCMHTRCPTLPSVAPHHTPGLPTSSHLLLASLSPLSALTVSYNETDRDTYRPIRAMLPC